MSTITKILLGGLGVGVIVVALTQPPAVSHQAEPRASTPVSAPAVAAPAPAPSARVVVPKPVAPPAPSTRVVVPPPEGLPPDDREGHRKRLLESLQLQPVWMLTEAKFKQKYGLPVTTTESGDYRYLYYPKGDFTVQVNWAEKITVNVYEGRMP